MTLSLTKRIAGGTVGLFVGTLLALAAPLTFAQTTTPDVPATGEGGQASANLIVLSASALALIAGGTYLARTRQEV